MERPVYHLKGVLENKSGERDFVGPLDLILHLLRKNKIAIRDIPLAGILAQYLDWVKTRQEMNLEVAGEFIDMASHLMLLKTRFLLSQEDAEAQSEMEALIASLEAKERQEEYRRLLENLPWLEARFLTGRDLFSKPPEKGVLQRIYRYAHTPEELPKVLLACQRRRGNMLPPALGEFQGIVRLEPYQVERKSRELMARLEQLGTTTFGILLTESESRSEATALFLALLELCRAGRFQVTGEMENPTITLLPPDQWRQEVEGEGKEETR